MSDKHTVIAELGTVPQKLAQTPAAQIPHVHYRRNRNRTEPKYRLACLSHLLALSHDGNPEKVSCNIGHGCAMIFGSAILTGKCLSDRLVCEAEFEADKLTPVPIHRTPDSWPALKLTVSVTVLET